jgi:geranylgeranyl pyrophosphate synthase
VGASELSDADVAAIQEVLVATGALAELEIEIEQLAAEAVRALPAAGLSAEAEQALTDLAHYVAWREK